MTDSEPSFDVKIEPGHFRSVLGNYPTGVCVITGYSANGEAYGMVVGSFTSVSLDPPLVAFFPDQRSSSWPKIRACGHFCVNVLGADQADLCNRFASKKDNKFEGISHRLSHHGMPILDGVLACIECHIDDEIKMGDHSIVIGRVISLSNERDIGPLLFLRGALGHFEVANARTGSGTRDPAAPVAGH